MSKARNPEARAPDAVDAHVGHSIRFRRHELNLTQQQLADAAGISFQQVQKYENGLNRVSASRLVRLARALEVPVAWFFENLEFERTQDGYRASVWNDTLRRLSELTGGLELARSLTGLTPDQVAVIAKLTAELAKLNERAPRPVPRRAA